MMTTLVAVVLTATLIFAGMATLIPQANAQPDRVISCPDGSAPPCNPERAIKNPCPDGTSTPCNPERVKTD